MRAFLLAVLTAALANAALAAEEGAPIDRRMLALCLSAPAELAGMRAAPMRVAELWAMQIGLERNGVCHLVRKMVGQSQSCAAAKTK